MSEGEKQRPPRRLRPDRPARQSAPRRTEGQLMAHIEGGCRCGKVRYSADTEPVFVGVCHCTDCQHFTGSAFATVVGVPASALKVTGTLKSFTKRGDPGKPQHRRFCP